MRRSLTAAFAALMLIGSGVTPALATQAPGFELDTSAVQQASKENPNKINIMGMWAHPDDDASFNTPCGIWHELEGLKCGIIMVTRGEGGSNSVGSEAGPDLGLRRENEDRTSHVMAGTVDIFNLDRVDFFYNTSAPLTAQAWDQEETLRRAVRVVRQTQPDIMTTWTPSLAAGHGNHQDAARLTWETVQAAADPTKFPEQLSGPHALKTWQVKRILERAPRTNRGETVQENCMLTANPDPDYAYPVVGTWTGYTSPYTWAAGNTANQPAGSHKTWAQVGGEGARVHATQARVMQKGVVAPSCLKWSMPWSMSPFQPESKSAGRSDLSALYGAAIADPGGFPLGSTFTALPETFRVGQGQKFTVQVKIASGDGTLEGGEVSLGVPAGWTASPAQYLSKVGTSTRTLNFTVTAAPDAKLQQTRIKVNFAGNRGLSAYNETTVLPVPAVEGRFARWGNTAEYEQWAADHNVSSGGVSPALDRIGAGESMTLPVTVTNRSTAAASGQSKLTLPAGIVAENDTISFTDLAPGASKTLKFTITHQDPNAPGGTNANIKLDTTAGGSVSSETLNLYVVPTAVIPELSQAPALNGDDSAYTTALDISRKWEGSNCSPDGVDCGSGSQAKVGWYGDDLYVWAKVIDDTASAAATPDRCFGHWLVDSLEILLDPTGRAVDTSSTFKLGVFPFTDDAANYNGNGANGPCWSRDADNHQGFSTGPLADRVENAPNAPGVKVFASAAHPNGAYTDGSWLVEVKIPLKDLPAEVGPTSDAPTGDLATNTVDPRYMGMNLTPYDSDTQDFIGQTRLAWSPFGSQQSEPYRWGHAYLDGYAGNGLPAEPAKALIPQTALQSAASPQTIFQSAARGVTIAGLNPTDKVSITGGTVGKESIDLKVKTEDGIDGTLRAFLWKGDPSFVPVWTSSCAEDVYGVDACSAEDGKARPWSTAGMGGHVLASASGQASAGKLSIPLDADALSRLGTDVQLLVSFSAAGTTSQQGGVDAWAIPLKEVGAASTSATVSGLVYNSTAKATVTVSAKGTTQKPTGSVTVTIKGKSYSGTLVGGKLAFAPSALIPAGATAKIVYTSDDEKLFTSSTSTVKLAVAKATPKVKAKLSAAKVTTSARAKVSVSATIPGKLGARASKFTVQVFDGKKKIRTAKLSSSGTAKVTLPKLKKGTHKLTVKVLGTPNTASASKKLVLKVVR